VLVLVLLPWEGEMKLVESHQYRQGKKVSNVTHHLCNDTFS
jgi:hypothetical protein